MSEARLQDTKSTSKNKEYFYIVATNNQKLKTNTAQHNTVVQHSTKEYEIGVNLTKDVQGLSTKNYKTLL